LQMEHNILFKEDDRWRNTKLMVIGGCCCCFC